MFYASSRKEESNREEAQWPMASCSLWMGDIEPYMNENFIKESFALVGEEVVSVKIIKSRYDGTPAGYGFVVFKDKQTAQNVLHKHNRRQIPNAPLGKKFKLNTTGKTENFKEYSIFVGDLPPEIDDITLLTGFSSRYPSVKSAKVICDSEGRSKCFGFVKFENECEFEVALRECHNLPMFGIKKVRVSVAIPKHRFSPRNMRPPNILLSTHTGDLSRGDSPVLQAGGLSHEQYKFPEGYSAFSEYHDPCSYCYAGAYSLAGGYPYFPQSWYDSSGNTNYTWVSSYVDHSFGQPYDVDVVNGVAAATHEDLWASLHDSLWY